MEQVDKIYANALFELAQETNKIEDVKQDISDFYEMLNTEKELVQVLSTPVISSPEKKSIIDDLFKDNLDIDVLNFLKLLVDNGRISALNSICEAFLQLYRESKGIVIAEVISISKLDDETLAKLKGKLESVSNKNVEIKEKIDESLIGGLKIIIGDKVIDSSALSKLNKLRDSLKEAVL